MKLLTNTLLITTILIGSSVIVLAQEEKNENKLKTLFKLDLGLQGVGFTFEPRIGKNFTVDLSLGAGGSYSVAEGDLAYTWGIVQPSFYASITPKFYYNLKKRLEKGKSLLNNSGNYIGLRLKYITPSIGRMPLGDHTGLINVHWGMQRPLGFRWTLNFHAGLGYSETLDSNFGTIYPAIDCKFSYLLKKCNSLPYGKNMKKVLILLYENE